MSEEIKNKNWKKIRLTEEELDKVSGGSTAAPEDEYTWSCSNCRYSITTVGYGYSYDKCPWCGVAVKVDLDLPEDFPVLWDFN